MKTFTFAELSPKDRDLVSSARKAADNAYAPYSGFAVGAAARAINGKVHVGANMENAVYGLGLCAEVSALTAANTGGDLRRLEAVAVVGFNISGKLGSLEVVTPCGRCRQLICESSHLSGLDVDVFACSGDLERIELYKISEMLPRAFGSEFIGSLRESSPPGNPPK